MMMVESRVNALSALMIVRVTIASEVTSKRRELAASSLTWVLSSANITTTSTSVQRSCFKMTVKLLMFKHLLSSRRRSAQIW